jgi:hypothetical protein
MAIQSPLLCIYSYKDKLLCIVFVKNSKIFGLISEIYISKLT